MTSPLEQQDRERLIRIDERTAALVNTFDRHLDQNRDDFAKMGDRITSEMDKVHSRIGRVERKVHWIVGIGTGGVAVVALALSWARSVLTS